LLARVPNDRGILAHLTLKGNFIGSQADSTLLLDGEAFGAKAGVVNPLALTSVAIAISGTGITGTGGLAADGAMDDHYKLLSSADPTAPGPRVFVATIPPWIGNGPNSKWIAPLSDAAAALNPGVYKYRTTFDLTGLDPTTAELHGQWAA